MGNVLATITDKKLQVSTNNSSTSYFEAEVQSVQDYYAFGMQMPGRKSSGGYRYGFNGKENDNVTGEGNLDFGVRILDVRLGRWLSVDPAFGELPGSSPYCSSLDNPIILVDKDGKFPIVPLLLKMATAGASDYMTQVAMNYFFNDATRGDISKSVATENINFVQVARSTVEGAIPWKTPGGKLGKAAATALGDVIYNYGESLVKSKEYTTEQAVTDFATGFISDLAGGEIGGLISKYGARGFAKGLSKMGFDDKKIEEILTGAGTTWKGAVDYSDLDLTDKMAHTRGVGKDFTTNQKDKIKKLNKDKNNGYLRSDKDGSFLEKGKAGGNNTIQAEVDHKQAKKHKTNPGTNKFSNAQLLSRKQNGAKSNN
ncbi:MAG: hypothetical protein IM571_09470 [Chitinophagaceae bacterium]|nr:hypothetical protein [Chitinophagaceae bacterium]MCA6469603.1 hypothetical protein [Chitinophagaceae bacterium]MCA6478168.1 hypothetical protein [Chitinophagaceae bacterium]MCA6484671.1 hypothetical protein [Chitinophagaceae bacterium]